MFKTRKQVNELIKITQKLSKDLNYAEHVIFRLMNDVEENTFTIAEHRAKLGLKPREATDDTKSQDNGESSPQ